jgi:hypothetical protein
MTGVKFTAHHRKCLQNGCCGGSQGENEAQLYTGSKVRQECLDRGWLERLPDSLSGFKMYRTTDCGRAMLRAPVLKLPSQKTIPTLEPRVKMLQPRVKTLEPRIKTLKTPRKKK